MTTTFDTENTAQKTRGYPEQVTMVIDQPDLAPLLHAGLHPSALPCERCGLHQGRHRSTADCPHFVRPRLPAGFDYADRLVPGQTFGFLPVGTQTCIRRVVTSTCCAVGALTVLTSTAHGCQAAIHWVDGSLVVATR